MGAFRFHIFLCCSGPKERKITLSHCLSHKFCGVHHTMSEVGPRFRISVKIAVAVLVLNLLTLFTYGQNQVITLDGRSSGRSFDGIGAVSSGGSSRLLIDYPEPYRGQILDYLFKPNYGASLHSLKVEIGGDEDSGGGAEPTHMRSIADQNYTRGYEWWLMQQAKLRNPNIKLQALAWGAPGWVGNGTFYSQDGINYIINFIVGAKNTYGLTIDYIGTLNETPYNETWIKNLKDALIANGLSTKLVAADESTGSGWYIVNDMLADSALMSAVDEIGEHYVGYSSTYYAKLTGKPLWASEDGPWRGDWPGAMKLAKIYNQNYIQGRITMTEIWSLLSAYYDVMPLAGAGLMYANTPWSGFYNVQPAIWATAHTTQFVQPGWQYLDNSSGNLANVGSYVTLKNGNDYSVIIETVDMWGPQTAQFNITGGLSTGTVHVWKTDANSQFVQQSDITPVNGSFTMSLVPGSIYSLTTTSGQTKGSAVPAPTAAFPFPFNETFESYTPARTPKYFSTIDGAFEVSNCGAGRSGNCLRQVVTTPPIAWRTAALADPASFVGAISWTSYQVSSDVLLEQPGTVKLIGRLTAENQTSGNLSAYQLEINDTGAWRLRLGSFQTLASGNVPFSLNTWHTLKLILNGSKIQGVIDGVLVANTIDTTYVNGMAGLGSAGWTNAQFDNFRIDPVDGVNIIPQSQMAANATNQMSGFEASRAIDGDMSTFWHTGYACDPSCHPVAALPQSITLRLGGTFNVSKLRYLPRQDGAQNGTVTQYNIYVSSDGVNFTPVASGSWSDDATEKAVLFTPTSASFVRLEALAGHAGYASAAEINVEFRPAAAPPAITSLAPSFVTAGSAGFALTVAGTNFVNGAVVRWNGLDRMTTFSSSNSLSANILATDLIAAGTAGITVFNPDGRASNLQNFTIAVGIPVISSLTPSAAIAGAPAFSLTVAGSNFGNGAVVRWNGSDRVTAFSNSTSLSANILATDLTAAGTAVITVINPDGGTSSPQNFTIATGAPSLSNFITAVKPGTLRHNYSGWVGMSITVGSSPLQVNSLGRFSLSGNSGTHVVKIVNTTAVADVPGGSVKVNMAGSAPGTFVYGELASPLTLTPNTTYYLLSQENDAGDDWYDFDSKLQTTGIVALNGPAYGTALPFAFWPGSPGTSLVPVDFTYRVGVSVQVTPLATSLSASQTQLFSADAPVSWSITPSGSGSISNTGLYTAPANIPSQQTVTVTATRLSDSAVSGNAVITLLPAATGGGTNFLRSTTLGTPRKDYAGWVGMSLTVGPTPMFVNSLGRMFAPGNVGSHILKIVNATTGADLPGAAVTVSMAGGNAGNFIYSGLASPVTLGANTAYYLLSQETQGGDSWYDLNTTAQTTADATLKAPVYGTASPFVPVTGLAGHMYVPVDLGYSLVTQGPLPDMSFVLSSSPGTPRNNYSGWVGMSVTVGGSPIDVSSLGRLVLVGNTGSHVVKIVNASTGADLPGGAVTVATAGAAAGTIAYSLLPAKVTLSAHTTYYILSQEVQGADSWYDLNDSVQTRSDGIVDGPVYGTSAPFVSMTGMPGHTYVPLDFRYSISGGGGSLPRMNFELSENLGTPRNNYSGWVGMSVTVGSVPLTINSLGRIFVAGNNGNHALKIVHAGTEADLPGALVTVSMAGGTPGMFVYADLASTITLSPNTTYYFLSQETQFGDAWYDLNTSVQTTGDAVVNAPVYGPGSSFVAISGLINHTYVPLDFQYTK